MLSALILNASLLVALISLYNLLARVRVSDKVWLKILSGLLFGAVTVASMLEPFRYAPGIIYDGRSIVLAMAGLFGGGIVSMASILVAGIYRAWLGGNGVWAGLATILTSGLLGLAFRRLSGNRPARLGIPALYGIGILVHIAMLACQLLVIPWPAELAAIGRVWLPIMLIFPVATVLMGVLLRGEDRRQAVEAALREREDEFKHIFENSAIGNSLTQVNGEISVNRTFCEMLGYSREELQDKKWPEITHPEDVALTQAEMNGLLSGQKEAARYTKRYLKKDGSVVWADVSSTVRRGAAGKPMYFMTSVIDISERKQAEEALLESEEKFRVLAETSPFGIYAYREKFIYVNPAFESLTGYTTAELMGMNFWELVHPDSRDLVRQRGAARLKGEKVPDHYEIKFVRKNGEERWMDASATAVQLGREPTGIGIFSDITERKRTEEALRQSEAALRQAQHVAQVGSWAWHIQANRLECSDEMYAIFGISKEDFSGDFNEVINRFIHPEDRAAVEASNQSVIKNQKPVPLEYRVVWPDGSVHVVWAKAGQLILDEAGNSKTLTGIVQDITGRKQAQTLQEAFYRIASAADTSASLEELYPQIHQIIAAVMPAENFYIGLYDEAENLLRFPYFRDPMDENFKEGLQPGKGLNAYVLRTGRPLLCTPARRAELESQGEISQLGAPSAIWLGVPLVLDGKTTGVMAVQDYDDPQAYGEREQRMLEFVSTQVALAIDRKQAEEMLQRQAQIMDQVHEGIVATDLQGLIVSWNQGAERLLGYTQAEVLGKPFAIVYPPGQLGILTEEIQPQVRKKGWHETELHFRSKSGQEIPVDLIVAALKDAKGAVVGMIGSAIDIRERKRAESLQAATYRIAQAADQATTLEALYPAIHAIIQEVMLADNFYIAIQDEENDLLHFPYLVDQMESAPASPQKPGKGLTEYVLRTGKALLCDERLFEQLLQQGEIELVGPSSPVWVGVPLVAAGRTLGMMAIQDYKNPYTYGERELRMLEYVSSQVANAIQRKQAEQQLKQYSDHLEETVESRTRELRDAQEQLVRKERLAVLGQLAGGVGHELRNPLSIINSAVYYLKLVQPEAPDKVRQYHATIEQEVRNADKIISDLLDFSRINSVERQTVSVPELVQRVLARFPVPESVTTRLELPADLPEIFADPRQVEQVLGNLTVNACQAMVPLKRTGLLSPGPATGVAKAGTLTISAGVQNDFVAIAVQDTGTGVLPENMPKLFEPLFTTKARGIGLGLAVSKKLAEANGGRIEVESEVGIGSTFTLVLPIHGIE